MSSEKKESKTKNQKDSEKKNTTRRKGNSSTKSSNKISKGESKNKSTSKASNKNAKVNGKGKSSEKKENKKLKTEHILLAIFILLLIVVICLSFMVVKKKKENEDKLSADLVIPVLKAGTEENVSLNLSSLAKEDEYVLKITNYRDKKINDKELPYTITVLNETDSSIEVTKDYSAQNLMIDQESIIIEDQKLRGKVKQDVYYHIKVVDEKNVSENDIISIKVNS